MSYINPAPHPAGYIMPTIGKKFLPKHVGIVMDGNGRWANQRGLPRTEGHRAGEAALLDVMAGAVKLGIQYVSVYAFSTENWKRSPEEVAFLMGFSRDVLRRQRDTLNSWGVRIRWNGQERRLWKSVTQELRDAEEFTRSNTGTQLIMCVNYGGRSEITNAVQQISYDIAAGKISPRQVSEKLISGNLHHPDVPDVDLFIRTSGEQRLSNFLLWQSAYAELVFLNDLWPDVDRNTLWDAVKLYASRDRRYGAAIDAPIHDHKN